MPAVNSNGNGKRLKVESWSDALAIATLMSMFLGVVAWGLKLEAEINLERQKLNQLIVAISSGILPRSEERINHITGEVDSLERRLDRLEERAESHYENSRIHPSGR